MKPSRDIGLLMARGWVLDEGEQEVGVRCVAAPVPGAPTPCAVSVSGPVDRIGRRPGARWAGDLIEAAASLTAALAVPP